MRQYWHESSYTRPWMVSYCWTKKTTMSNLLTRRPRMPIIYMLYYLACPQRGRKSLQSLEHCLRSTGVVFPQVLLLRMRQDYCALDLVHWPANLWLWGSKCVSMPSAHTLHRTSSTPAVRAYKNSPDYTTLQCGCFGEIEKKWRHFYLFLLAVWYGTIVTCALNSQYMGEKTNRDSLGPHVMDRYVRWRGHG